MMKIVKKVILIVVFVLRAAITTTESATTIKVEFNISCFIGSIIFSYLLVNISKYIPR